MADRAGVETRKRTPERAAIVRQHYPAGTPSREILALCNALPGPPFSHQRLIGIWAAELGVKRPPGSDPFRKSAPPVDDPPRSVDATRHVVDATPADKPAAPVSQSPVSDTSLGARARIAGPSTWTQERVVLLRRDYPNQAVASDVLLDRINALPGAPISETWMHNYAVTALKMSSRRPEQVAPVPDAANQRRAVSREAIEHWCRGKGWHFDKFDIDAINRRCTGIGHPGFTVLVPRHGAAA